MQKKTVVVSLGGSLVVPDGIDGQYIRAFRDVVLEYVAKGYEFILIVGGGKTARRYQEAALSIDSTLTDEDRDWIGIHSTRLNAHLLRTVFRDVAYPRINTNPHNTEDFSKRKESVVIAAGYRPGNSTDYCATVLAKYFGASSLVNLSNIDYVYDRDPRKHTDAKRFETMSWKEFRAIVGDVWEPGLSAPFDPVAAKMAEDISLTVAIMNGKNFDAFRAYLDDKPFAGTVIS
jgi:uridylate kinase